MSGGLKAILFGVLCLIWSSTWVMIKVGLRGAPPMTSAGLRFIIASLVIFAILQRGTMPLMVAILARAFFGGPASLIGWIFLRETVTLQIAFGGGLVVSGIALAVFSRSHGKRPLDVRP